MPRSFPSLNRTARVRMHAPFGQKPSDDLSLRSKAGKRLAGLRKFARQVLGDSKMSRSFLSLDGTAPACACVPREVVINWQFKFLIKRLPGLLRVCTPNFRRF